MTHMHKHIIILIEIVLGLVLCSRLPTILLRLLPNVLYFSAQVTFEPVVNACKLRKMQLYTACNAGSVCTDAY